MNIVDSSKENFEFYKIMKYKYPNLKELSLENNILTFYEYSINLKSFKLSYLKENTFNLYPFDIFNIIKIHTDTIDELNYLRNNDYNANYLYMRIRTILVKNVLSNEEIETLNFFIEAYLNLKKYQDYLIDPVIKKYEFMQNVIRDNLYDNNVSITPGIQILMQKINESNGRSSSNSGPKLSLNNPNFPSTIDNEQDYSKAGYASIILILYVVINVGFMLAVLLLK